MGKLVPNELECPIVGLQHRVTPSTRRYLEDRTKRETISCRIEREPDNPFDDKAIKVIISKAPYKGMHIGYIPRTVAAIMAPAIDSGDIEIESAHGEITDVDAQQGTGTMFLQFKSAVRVKGAKEGGKKRKPSKQAK